MIKLTATQKEIEVKFYLSHPERFADRLISAGASLKRPRCHETNLRFDNEAGNLRATRRVLRLRKDDRVTLTFKGAGETTDGVSTRQEIEVTVSDFEKTREILEAAGYQPCFSYEKYRTTYDMQLCEVVLDELPFGWFCEIEGPTPQSISQVAELLGLSWEARIVDSYAFIFSHCCETLKLTINDLTFSNFKDIVVTPGDLGVSPADVLSE